jgi:ferredoxin
MGKIKHTTNLYKAFKTLRDTCRDAGSCANCQLAILDEYGDYNCIVYEWAKADDPENWKVEEL